jgi:hypothetical protein
MKYGAIAIRGGIAGMDRLSAKDIVLHLMTPRRSGLPRHKDYRRVADDLTRNRQSGEAGDHGVSGGLRVVNNRSEGNAPLTVQALVANYKPIY